MIFLEMRKIEIHILTCSDFWSRQCLLTTEKRVSQILDVITKQMNRYLNIKHNVTTLKCLLNSEKDKLSEIKLLFTEIRTVLMLKILLV